MDPITLRLLQKRAAQNAPRPQRPYYGPEGPNPNGVSGRAPVQPNFQALLASLAAGPPQRSEADWNSLLNPRVQPFIDSINQSTNMARGQNEFAYESKSAANQALSEGFLKILTGGKTGAEAEQYAKEQFGGQYLPAQAMSIAADHLRDLTHDFDENDWTITSKYMELMAEVPAVREELRAKVETQDQNDHKTKVEMASLLLDETWKLYNAHRTEFESDRNFKFEQTKYKDAKAAANKAYGQDIYNNTTDRIEAKTGQKNAQVRESELKLKRLREARAKTKDRATIRQTDQKIKIEQERLRLSRQKAKGGGSDAQKAETDLAIDILKDDDKIRGKPPQGKDLEAAAARRRGERVGGMSYQQAYDYVYGLADAQMGSYRNPAYINSWVKARLKALGYKGPQKRSGR